MNKHILLVFLCISQFCYGGNYLTYQYYNQRDGLPSNSIDDIAQDNEGYLYFATNKGLSIFDGNSFTNYSLINTPIFSNAITVVKEISSRKMLVGSRDKGLYVLDKQNDTILKVQGGPSSVSDVLKDSNGTIWVSSLEGSLWYSYHSDTLYKDNDSIKLKKVPYKFNSIYALEQVGDAVWIASHSSKLLCVRKDANQLLVEHIRTLSSVNAIYSLTSFSDNEVWLGTDHRLLELNKQDSQWEGKHFIVTGTSNIHDIIIKGDEVFVGTENDGFFSVNRNTYECISFSDIPAKSVLSLHFGRNGSLWLGTWLDGVYRLAQNGGSYHFLTHKERKKHDKNIIWNIYKFPKDTSYSLCTSNLGLCTYTTQHRYLDKKNNRYPALYSMFTDEMTPYTYFGTWGKGLQRMDKKKHKYISSNWPELKNERIYSIVRKDKNHLFIGTNQSGIWLLNERTQKLSSIVFPDSIGILNVRSIVPQYNGKGYWLGTFNAGLFSFQINKAGEITQWKQFKKYKNQPIKLNSLYRDGSRLWLCLVDGLAYIEEQDQTIQLKKVSSFNGLLIRNMVRYKQGSYWLSSNDGLFHYKQKDELTHHLMPDKDFYGLLFDKKSNRLICGSSFGIVSVKTEQLLNNVSQGKALIRTLAIDGNIVTPNNKQNRKHIKRAINYSDTLLLYPNNNVVRFSLSSLSLIPNIKMPILYKMEGLDEKWNKTESQTATAMYNHLPAGTYHFMIRLVSHDNQLGEKHLVIIKSDYWWNNTAIKISFILFLVLFVFVTFFFYYKRLYGIKYSRKIQNLEEQQRDNIYQHKMQFFTNISHDLKTPLTLLLTPIKDLIAHPQMPEIFQNRLKSMNTNGEVLLKKINKILNYRDMMETDALLNLEPVELTSFLYKTIFPFKEYAERQGLSFLFHLDELQPKMWTELDKSKLESILENLISNAIKYTASGGQVSVKSVIQENEFILSISDNGVGISEDQIDLIFDRYYRGQHDNSGTGIGLFLVKEYLNTMHATFKIDSVVDEGTSFELRIPLNKLTESPVQLDETVLDTQREEMDKGLKGSENHHSIIVVDDNKEMCDYLVDLLSPEYVVITASSGIEAVAIIKEKIPDLILTDLMMPDMDGLELCSVLKKDILTSHIPLVVLSAKNTIEVRKECWEIGVNLFEEKPFNSELLQRKIRSILRNRNLLKYKYQISPKSMKSEIGKSITESLDDKFIAQLNEAIDKNISNTDLSIQDLVKILSMSHDQLYRKLKALTGFSINQYIRTYRLNCAASMLASKKFMVTEVLYHVGFNNPSYFTRCFKKEFGVLPSEYVEEIID